jgi:hypothetical protein
MGRFISADTIVPIWNDPQTLNRYSYCRNNPLIYHDPSGHSFWDWIPSTIASGVNYLASAIGYVGCEVAIGIIYVIDKPSAKQAQNGVNDAFKNILKTQTGMLAGGVVSDGIGIGASAVISRATASSSAEVANVVKETGNTAKNAVQDTKALQPYYPPNRGFADAPTKTTLEPGTLIDRHGGTGGTFASPAGTPPYERSLPFGAETRQLNTYEVINPLDVDAGKAASWFNQPGGGTQYDLGRSIQELIDTGYIKPVQ